MVCLYCSSVTQVTNSRSRNSGHKVWRRRKCTNCQSVFTTTESVDEEVALIVECNDQYNAFLRDKLLLSVYESIKHRKTAITDAAALTDTIMIKLFPQFLNGKISVLKIKETVMQTLEKFDEASYWHYQAFHKK